MTEPRIIAFSGRKQSGKNCAFNCLLGIQLVKLAVVRDHFAIMNDGKLWISDIFGDKDHAGVFDVDRNNEEMQNFLEEYVYPYIKNYSFADALKRDICVNVLGLSYVQCFGTDDEKNTETHLRWEDMPGIISEKGVWDLFNTREVKARMGQTNLDKIKKEIDYHPPGPMTGREVMQYVGTELFRRMYGDVWADSCIRRINREQPLFAVITDCRFPNEVEAIQKAGGRVVRLTRGAQSKDNHPSETALDPENFDWNKFDAILDNSGPDGSIGNQNRMLLQMLSQWGWIDPVEEEKLNDSNLHTK